MPAEVTDKGREALTYLSALHCCCVVSLVCHSSCPLTLPGILWVLPGLVTTLSLTASTPRFIHDSPLLSAAFCAKGVLAVGHSDTVSFASNILQKDLLCSSSLFRDSQANLFPIHLQLLAAHSLLFKNIKSLTFQIVYRN